MKIQKRLFRVTLWWNTSDISEGDFCELVWAKDRESAIRELARRMSLETYEMTPGERREFIQDLVDGAGPYCAEDVGAQLPSELNTLLAGPSLVLTSKRTQALREIFQILERSGVAISSHVD
jgi:hypothetical protein